MAAMDTDGPGLPRRGRVSPAALRWSSRRFQQVCLHHCASGLGSSLPHLQRPSDGTAMIDTSDTPSDNLTPPDESASGGVLLRDYLMVCIVAGRESNPVQRSSR